MHRPQNAPSRDDILVVQLTGRMHFGAARGMQENGRLAALLTDFRVPPLLKFPAGFNLTLRHYCIDLPDNKVRGNPFVGLKYRRDIKNLATYSAQPHITASQKLAKQAQKVARHLNVSTIYAFDIQALETFRAFSGLGKRLVLEQCVAPRRTLMDLMARMADPDTAVQDAYQITQLEILAQREEAEWKLADLIICPSAYVKTELIRYGVAAEKSRLSLTALPPLTNCASPEYHAPRRAPCARYLWARSSPAKARKTWCRPSMRLTGPCILMCLVILAMPTLKNSRRHTSPCMANNHFRASHRPTITPTSLCYRLTSKALRQLSMRP